MIGWVTKLLNIPVIAVAVFQNFPRYVRRSNNLITFSYFQTKEIHNFRPHTQIEYSNKPIELYSSICRQEMVRSPQFNLFLFSKMTRRCNLKTCSYFGEVDNMQMICGWTHENILKQWGKSFSKQLEMPGSTHKYQGPKLHEGHRPTKLYENWSDCILIREAKVYLWCVHLYRQRDNWNLSGPSSIAGGPQSVIEACSYFFQGGGGSQKY